MSVINEVGLLELVGAALIRNISQRLVQVYTASNFSEILQRLKKNESQSCDLSKLPPEVGVKVLKCLSATDLALASCVWSDLSSDWSIWADLCKRTWRGPVQFYAKRPSIGWRQLYLLLDEATVRFNAQPDWGLQLLDEHNLLDRTNSTQIAHFIHGCESLHWGRVRQYLSSHYNILDEMTKLREWRGHFLPGALRSFFSMFHIPPLSQSAHLEASIAIFARHFHHDNPQLTIDAIQIMAYAIVLLSVDLSCNKNQIRNKMSKREFIKNTLRALENEECELFRTECGDYYDNIYLCGHIAPEKWE